MTIALIIIGDGRDTYHEQSVASAEQMLPMDLIDQRIIVDDRAHTLGFAGAVQHAWDQVQTDYAFHLEADFTFNTSVPLADMVRVLDAHPHLAQIALLRQPWNEQEKQAGGIVQMHAADYKPVAWEGHQWLEHRRNVTTNPSLWPRWVIDRGWPQRPQSEGCFGIDLFASDPAVQAAYWGRGEEWVTHIGDVRSGTGY